jgi:hypothetical protein
MATIRLYVEQSLRTPTGDVIDGAGRVIRLPFLRLLSFVRVQVQSPVISACIVDTGAPLSVIPLTMWSRFSSEVEWLTPAQDAPAWLSMVSGKTGGSAQVRVGRITLRAFDCQRPPQWLAAVPVIALFELAANGDGRVLIGLHASILAGRELRLDRDGKGGWLEE